MMDAEGDERMNWRREEGEESSYTNSGHSRAGRAVLNMLDWEGLVVGKAKSTKEKSAGGAKGTGCGGKWTGTGDDTNQSRGPESRNECGTRWMMQSSLGARSGTNRPIPMGRRFGTEAIGGRRERVVHRLRPRYPPRRPIHNGFRDFSQLTMHIASLICLLWVGTRLQKPFVKSHEMMLVGRPKPSA